MNCPALPEIITLDDYHGDYVAYQNFLYNVYKRDIKSGLIYNNLRISMRSHPRYLDKEESFYHFTCKENKHGDDERLPDLRRCERLGWIKPTIMTDHTNLCSFDCLKIYEKKGKTHLLNFEDRYLVVLDLRSTYILLVTAFYIEHDHTLNKKLKDYEKYKKAKSASQ